MSHLLQITDAARNVVWLLYRRFQLTRLETRTKESNTCANLWVIIWGAMKMTIGMCALIANQSTVRGLCLSMCIRTRKMVNYA